MIRRSPRKPTPLRPNRGVKRERPEVRSTKDGRSILHGDAYEDLKDQIYERAQGKCEMPACLYEGLLGRWMPRQVATLDHIEPRKMGGGSRHDSLDNCRLAHGKCNSAKGSKRDA